ncbi:MAG: hypothetical protein H6Q74_1588 [Firmicutes bacterium]|nr:hypothetical protein [Bacillota bacterium]
MMGGKYLDLVKRMKEPANNTTNEYGTAENVIKAIYAGTYKGSCLLPVLSEYQDILGKAVWVCSSERQAGRKRETEKEIVLTVDELKMVVNEAMRGKTELRTIIQAKQAFNGVFIVA